MLSNKTVKNLITQNQVIVFSKSKCPYCVKVQALFESLDIKFECIELDKLGEQGVAMQKVLFEKTNQKTVPSVFVAGTHIGGYDGTMKAYNDGTLEKLLNMTFTNYDYDLIVIGGGSGGLTAARNSAKLGMKVALCDFVVPSPRGSTWGLGGTCVNVGCIPKKLVHEAAIMGEMMKDAMKYGWKVSTDVPHSWSDMITEIQNHIKSLNFQYRTSLRENNVTYVNASAEFVDAHTIKTTNKKNQVQELTARRFIIAVGGRPKYPDIPGAKECAITSDDIFSLPYHPGKCLIVGASYIALECAGFLSVVGVDCTVMVRSILLRGFDKQMAELVGTNLSKIGVKFLRRCVPTSIEKLLDGEPGLHKVRAMVESGESVEGEYNTILFAIGRSPCTTNIGLEDIGVKLNNMNKKIIVDEKECTSVNSVYAIGDTVDGKPELTPVAIQAGKLLTKRLYGGTTTLMDYLNIPTTIFTPMEYSCVGMTEEGAIEKYGEDNIEVYHASQKPYEFAIADRRQDKCYGKMICIRSEQERVVGLHFLGPNAGEIMQGFAIGLKLKARKSDFNNLIGIHPTNAEMFVRMDITKASGISVETKKC